MLRSNFQWNSLSEISLGQSWSFCKKADVNVEAMSAFWMWKIRTHLLLLIIRIVLLT